jgi:8-oxo-dGTP pyrophosphatase MutT (NUDIX family)
MTDIEVLCEQFAHRLQPLDELPINRTGPAQAAVVLILRQFGEDVELLLIKRAEHPEDPWSGHLALPGGRAESDDHTLLDTAVRETREEIGLDLSASGRFLGRLSSLWPGNPRLPRIEITPLVAVAPPESSIQLSAEVEDAFWVPITRLRQQGRSDAVRLVIQGQVREWPAYPSTRGPVWGITERILTQFLSLLE